MAGGIFYGGADGRVMSHGGHSAGPQIYGGRGMVYKYAFNNDWSDVATFGSSIYGPDGNRSLTYTSRNAQYWHMEQCVLNRNGYPPDNSPPGKGEMIKLEGSDNAILDTVLRNGIQEGALCDSGSWSSHMRRNRIAHCVFDTLGGPIVEVRDYLDDGPAGTTRISDLQIRNCLVRNVLQNTITSWANRLLVVVCSSGVNWQNVIQMHGVTIQDPTRTADSIYVDISRGVSPPGTRSLTYMMANYPANFSNITVQTGELFTSPPATSIDILPSEISTYYAPSVTANGVDLTLANGAGSSSTSLVVDDSRYFTDPRWLQMVGESNPQVYIDGVGNVSYSAINYATHTLTLVSAQTWADNAPINRAITSGATPNRGAVR